MNESNHCPIADKSDLPWAIPLPKGNILKAPDLWRAIQDPECKTKGRMISVLSAALSHSGMFGNECPQEVRDRIRKMSL